MDPGKLSQIAKNWIKAFNDHDLDAVLALYSDEVTHFSPKLKARHPETRGFITGKAALQEWWADAFQRLPSLQYRLISVTSEGTRVVIEYKRTVEGKDPMMVAEFFEIGTDGLIVSSRVYHG